jgi:hypothetical protein
LRRAKDRRFIVELQDRAMNRLLSLHVKIESESSAFGIKGSSGEERVAFCCKLSLLWSGGRAPMTKHHLVFVVFESSSEIN